MVSWFASDVPICYKTDEVAHRQLDRRVLRRLICHATKNTIIGKNHVFFPESAKPRLTEKCVGRVQVDPRRRCWPVLLPLRGTRSVLSILGRSDKFKDPDVAASSKCPGVGDRQACGFGHFEHWRRCCSKTAITNERSLATVDLTLQSQAMHSWRVSRDT